MSFDLMEKVQQVQKFWASLLQAIEGKSLRQAVNEGLPEAYRDDPFAMLRSDSIKRGVRARLSGRPEFKSGPVSVAEMMELMEQQNPVIDSLLAELRQRHMRPDLWDVVAQMVRRSLRGEFLESYHHPSVDARSLDLFEGYLHALAPMDAQWQPMVQRFHELYPIRAKQ